MVNQKGPINHVVIYWDLKKEIQTIICIYILFFSMICSYFSIVHCDFFYLRYVACIFFGRCDLIDWLLVSGLLGCAPGDPLLFSGGLD